jgi:hypothetical protein
MLQDVTARASVPETQASPFGSANPVITPGSHIVSVDFSAFLLLLHLLCIYIDTFYKNEQNELLMFIMTSPHHDLK